MKRFLTATAAIALVMGAAHAQDNADEAPAAAETTTASASFVNMEGETNGTATLTGTPEGVLIELDVTGLPAGEWVAFHVHETGECDAETDHDSAGGHFNPTDAPHGYHVEGGPHAGDMPNQYVDSEGTLRAQVFNSMVTLDEGEAGILGRALMVHGGADDYESQPSGDAGARHACGVIE